MRKDRWKIERLVKVNLMRKILNGIDIVLNLRNLMLLSSLRWRLFSFPRIVLGRWIAILSYAVLHGLYIYVSMEPIYQTRSKLIRHF